MYIIYHCVGGAHSSVIASAIHLGMLPIDRRATIDEILAVPYFDRLTKKEQGRILLRGIDEDDNKIFTLGRQFCPKLIIPAIKDTWELAGGKIEQLVIVNTMPAVNLLMKLGGFSSRRLNLVFFGRPIVAKGSQQAYSELIEIVKDTKSLLKH